MTKRLAIIPARGGSKRIPNKNIRDFAGKPMISHIITKAISSKLFDKIHVSTDSEEIARIAIELGLEIDFYRDKDLCDDYTPIMPVLKYVLNKFEDLGHKYDEVWSLMACAPMVTISDLIGASDIMTKNNRRAPLLAVAEYPAPVEWAFKKKKNKQLEPMMPGKFALRSQDIETSYFDAGAFSVFPSEIIFKSQGAGSDEGFLGYPILKSKAIDIDTIEDWDLAESIFNFYNKI